MKDSELEQQAIDRTMQALGMMVAYSPNYALETEERVSLRRVTELVREISSHFSVFLPIFGALHGVTMLVLPKESADFIAEHMLQEYVDQSNSASREQSQRALSELQNIITGNYLSTHAENLGKRIDHLPPITEMGQVDGSVFEHFFPKEGAQVNLARVIFSFDPFHYTGNFISAVIAK